MRVVSNKTLEYWKQAEIAMRQHVNELRKALKFAKRKVKYYEGKVLVCVLLLVFIGGCNMVNGAFKDGAWLLDKAAENTEVQDK